MMFQTYIPDLYWKVKQFQHSLLHDECESKIDWSDLEATFRYSVSDLPCLNPLHPMSLTTDLYTGRDHETYICLTAHFFDAEWNMKRFLLDIFLCTDRHTGENISDWIKQVLSENNISVRCLMLFDFPLPLLSPDCSVLLTAS